MALSLVGLPGRLLKEAKTSGVFEGECTENIAESMVSEGWKEASKRAGQLGSLKTSVPESIPTKILILDGHTSLHILVSYSISPGIDSHNGNSVFGAEIFLKYYIYPAGLREARAIIAEKMFEELIVQCFS